MKSIIAADIHIEDYPNYNFDYQSRLKQFDALADRFIELAKEYGCDEIWILGDLVDKPNCRPYVLHEAQKFVKKLCKHFKVVRYILGNHDLDSKSINLDENDAQITVFDEDNLVYMDHQIMTCNGHKYGFMNWRPNQSLEWLGDEHLDILFGHYTKSALFGQDIDESKFDLMIHGDIHNSQVIGKFVSVCNPIQKDMSSEQEGKVIIFDTDTMEWKRVLVDPDHTRFLQISYTDDQAMEGFRGPLQYNIYKPEIKFDDTQDEQGAIKWNDIDELINNSCKSNNLDDIHDEIVSKCPHFTEIDFNFQITSLKIHGYRSIEDLELTFNQGDRIALLGANGSGKSSIIRALQGAFSKNSDLKYEQSDFTEDMNIEVKLVYQNKVYEIHKGWTWGLTIDGQDQPYHGIRDFEADLLEKLPFLNYLDLYFLRSNISNLSEAFSPTKRIELISKFYRLDRISAYNSTAHDLYNELNKELIQLQSDRNVKVGIKDHIVSRITELQSLNLKTSEDYLQEIESYRGLRSKYFEYKNWKSKLDDLNSDIDLKNRKIDSIKSKLSFDYDKGLQDLADLKDKESKVTSAYDTLYAESIEFENTLKEFKSVMDSGKVIKTKLDKILSGVCPECGASLAEGKLSSLKSSYQTDLDNLRSQWSELDDKLSKYPKGADSKEYYLTNLNNLKTSHKELKDNIELLNNKLMNFKSSQSALESEESNLNELLRKLDDHKSNEVEEVKLPVELNELESNATANLSKVKELGTQLEERTKIEGDISTLDGEISVITSKMNKFNAYIELTSVTGTIYEEILTKLAVRFTSSDVKYEVESGYYRGSRYINFNSYYLSKGKFRPYESCSDGQKTVCDLDFLNNLFSVRIGLLTLDEYLKHLDDNNFSRVCDIITNMNVNTIILSTHEDSLTACPRRILLHLDNTGRTVMDLV